MQREVYVDLSSVFCNNKKAVGVLPNGLVQGLIELVPRVPAIELKSV